MNHSRKRTIVIRRFVILCACALVIALIEARAQSVRHSGVVTDESGSPIANAGLALENPNGALVQKSSTDNQGKFSFESLAAGSYVLTISASKFEPRRMILEVPRYQSPKMAPEIAIKLSPAQIRGEITITANRGAVVETENSAPVVSVREQSDFRARPIATIGNALENAVGVMTQQSAYGQVSPFLRGLTGYQVLNLIDGVRFNNSTFRSGPNQYLAFAEPSQVQRVEAMLGPASSQYGSDALGGAIQLVTLSPNFSGEPHGELQTFAASADASAGADAKFSIGSERLAWLAGGSWRRLNDLRAGGGADSRHVFKRFFGLSDDLIRDLYGSRQQDTGFTQYGAHTKLAARMANDQNLTLWYQRSDLDRVRGYKDLWGGLGRLRSDFEPQALQFFYARYEKSSLGFLDSLSGTFSINSQSDGSIRQGLRASNTITRDESEVNSFGYALQATTHIANRNAVVFGGEIYNERIGAWRDDTDPRTNTPVEKRALYPNGSRYTTYGLFAQDTLDLVRGKVRATFGGRYTRASFKTFADQNRDAAGNNLGVIDSARTFDDLTFNANLSWQLSPAFALNFLSSRGFRAPNLNDLGALGLNDLGYEIPAEAAASAGGLIGVSDGEGVASNGRKVGSLEAERLFNYEFGATLRLRRLYVRAHAFDAELKDPIVRRTLLFPVGGAPSQLAGVAVTPIAQTAAQRAQNVVSVATPIDPRAVKAFVNEGKSKYYGVETIFHYTASPQWSVEGNYSYLVGRELNPNRFIRRLPPQQGFLAIRFQPGGRSNWIELSGNFSGPQERLSGGDITDERIGAARRRSDITDFFQGSLIRPFINAGTDGVFGTVDDLFTPTNETAAQIRDRVLPIGATINGVTITDDNSRAPLYTKTAGFASLNLRGGIAITENVSLNVALRNLLDRNYRVHGSGIDAPGVNLFVGVNFSF